MKTKTTSETVIGTDVPPVCEIGDLVRAGEVHWIDPADADCEGLGAWLFVGDSAPSPLCDKHARLLRERALDDLPPDMRLVRS